MALIRASRNDRRRRTMREAVAADSGVAVETVRARSRRRQAAEETEDQAASLHRRDPGYSQEVRFACQQRLVQLIPVRKVAMATLAGVLGGVWLCLILAHYLLRIAYRPLEGLPIEHFFDLRSPHGLSHWLGCQFWLLTGIASLLILQLRRHKLDDYRAKYRIWIFLAIGCFFSSFDAETSALYIIGLTIDPWTQRELGYHGWPVVLASYASLVGVLGLRLCTELKSSPGSVTLWLFGLLSWAFSAVVGTGLFKLAWDAPTIDLAVGSTWLGGIFCVFLAATLYLRHIYIQAQKRFALRNKWLAERAAWQMPKLQNPLTALSGSRFASGLKSKFRRGESITVGEQVVSEKRNVANERADAERVAVQKQAFSRVQEELEDEDYDDEDETEKATSSRPNFTTSRVTTPTKVTNAPTKSEKQQQEEKQAKPAGKSPWFGWLQPRPKPELGEDYSDLGKETRVRDRGLATGFEKVGTVSESTTAVASKAAQSTKEASEPSKSRFSNPFRRSRKPAIEGSEGKPVAKTAAKPDLIKSGNTDVEVGEKSKRNWSFSLRRKPAAEPKAKTETEGKPSRRLFSRSAKPVAAEKAKPTVEKVDKPKKKFRPFGFLDSLTLKPPTATAAPTTSAAKSQPELKKSTTQPQINIPSTSSVSTSRDDYDEPMQSASMGNLDEIEDSAEYRNMSKAERKRLRRQQGQNRAA